MPAAPAREENPPRPAGVLPGEEADPALVLPWRRRPFWLAFTGYWVAYALLVTGTHMARSRLLGDPLPVPTAMAVAFSDAFFIALHCLGAFAVAWRLPLEGKRSRTLRNLALATVGAYCVTAGVQWTQTAVGSVIVGVPVPPLPVVLLIFTPSLLLYFTCFMALGYAIRYYFRAGQSSRAAARLATESARLEAELARAELQLARSHLQVLKMQLDPHFLFNTFNAIATLMHRDTAAADAMLTRLSELLRITLSRSGHEEVTLGEELDFLRRYLEIQQSRFGERLTVEWRIGPGTEAGRVPHLILQPIVENAIQHGISGVPGPGWVRITSRREGEVLRLEVSDSGPGIAEDWTPRPGALGLANTHARLERMYGDRQTLELHGPGRGGATVSITFPFRPAGAATQEAPCAS